MQELEQEVGEMTGNWLGVGPNMKITLEKGAWHYVIRLDKLGRRHSVLVVPEGKEQGYALGYTSWLTFVRGISGGHAMVGFNRKAKRYFTGRNTESFEADLKALALPYRMEPAE